MAFPSSWKRAAAWAGIALIVLALAGYFTASMLLNNYLRGEAFRALLNAKTSELFAAEGAYQPIQREGVSFYSDRYDAAGRPGTALKNLKVEQIRAEFEPAAVFRGAWCIGSLQARRLQANIMLPTSPAPTATEALPSPAASAPVRVPGWIPSRFELRKARVENADLSWTLPGAAAPAGSLRRMQWTVEPSGTDWTAAGQGGLLEQAGWPALRVNHVKLRYRAPDLFVTDSLLEGGDAERYTVSGQAGLAGGRPLDFLVQWSGVPVARHLPEDWRAGVKGLAGGEARVQRGADGKMTAKGTLRLAGGQLEALPVLEKIAAFTRTREFRQFALQKAEADFTWTPGKLSVSRFVAESEGLIRAEGPFTVEGGLFEGVLQVGVKPASLRWLPGSQARVFTEERDGYVWTAVRVTGPLSRLSEDLTPRLVSAAGDALIDGAKGTLQEGAKTLQEGAKSLQNGTKNLFDLIKPLAP